MLKVNGNMKVEDIFQGLKEVANPEDAIHMEAYMKDQFEFLGVKTPIRRQISKIFFIISFSNLSNDTSIFYLNN